MLRGLRSARLGAIGARRQPSRLCATAKNFWSGRAFQLKRSTSLKFLAGRKSLQIPMRCKNKSRRDSCLRSDQKHSIRTIDEDGQAGVVIDGWMSENNLAASALQCWTAMEEFYGVVPCTLMSMMSNGLMPSACETDIGRSGGYVCHGAGDWQPSAIVDWNNNYGEDPDKAVIFHCSNLPKDIFVDNIISVDDIPAMDYQAIIAGTVGKENTYGTVVGRVRAMPFTYCRVSTDEFNGNVQVYLGEGRLTDDPLKTFGGYGVVESSKSTEIACFHLRKWF